MLTSELIRNLYSIFRMSHIIDPLYLPLKRGGLVCQPLESTYDIQWSGWKICVHLCDLWETKIIIRVVEIIFSLFIIPSRTR